MSNTTINQNQSFINSSAPIRFVCIGTSIHFDNYSTMTTNFQANSKLEIKTCTKIKLENVVQSICSTPTEKSEHIWLVLSRGTKSEYLIFV